MSEVNVEKKMTKEEFIEMFKAQGFELYKTEDLKPKFDKLKNNSDKWVEFDKAFWKEWEKEEGDLMTTGEWLLNYMDAWK